MTALIVLSRSEVLAGAMVGMLRRVESIFAGRAQTVPGLDADGLGWTRDIESALAEQAFAKYANRYWDASVGRFRSQGGDVGETQVRSTTHQDGHLVIRPHDSDHDIFVLMIGVAPQYRLCGYIRGLDAKQAQYLRDPGGRGVPCWWVPQDRLKQTQRV